MCILSAKPLGLSLLCLVIVLGATHGYDTISISQPPSTALPPASAPVSIAQPPGSTVFPPASAPISIAQPPTTTLPPGIAQPPGSIVFPPSSAPKSIAEPPSSTVLPPASAPVQQAPSHTPPRKLVAVQGVVYCKPCDNRGVENLGAAPLEGAVVKLQCKNTKYPLVVQTKTDKNGNFFINAPKTLSTYGYHKCRVFLVDSPVNDCKTPSNLNDGVQGAMLMRSSRPPGSAQTPVDYEMFNVGPFAFGHKLPCPSSVH